MTPATQSLKTALPILNPALEQGTQVLGRTPPLNARLQQTMDALKTLAQAPGTNVALNGADRHGADAQPDGPLPRARTRPCATTGTTGGRTWPSTSPRQTAFGFAQRALLMTDQPDAAQQRRQPGRHRAGQRRRLRLAARAANEFPHGQAYGAAIDNQGNADCETGQRGYPKQAQRSRPAEPQPRHRPAHPGRPGTDLARPRPVPPARRSRAPRRPAPSSRTSRGTTDAQATRRDAGGMSTFKAGLIALVAIVGVHLPRLHQVRQPVRQPSTPSTRSSPTPTA